MTREQLAEGALALVDAIARETQNISVPSSLKNRLALAAYGTVLEHQHAIAILVREWRLPSAFALLRSLWEAYIRALWIVHCATDDEIEVASKKKMSGAKDVVAALEAHPELGNGELARFKGSHWSAMCDYAHTGALQLQRWQGEEYVEPHHSVEETAEVLYVAGLYGAFAGAGQAALADDIDKAQRLLMVAEELKP